MAKIEKCVLCGRGGTVADKLSNRVFACCSNQKCLTRGTHFVLIKDWNRIMRSARKRILKESK
jgi:hypothetical protein